MKEKNKKRIKEPTQRPTSKASDDARPGRTEARARRHEEAAMRTALELDLN